MDIVRLELDALTDAVFAQIVELEANCGISPYPPEVLRACIAIDDTYACMVDGAVAGFITVDTAAADYFDRSLHIVNVNVAASCRRQGIAQHMIRTGCGRYTVSHAGQMVTLDVEKSNLPALNLYRKLGFTLTDMPSENGPTDVVMAAPLARLIAPGAPLP